MSCYYGICLFFFAFGSLLFFDGFLLTRREIGEESDCNLENLIKDEALRAGLDINTVASVLLKSGDTLCHVANTLHLKSPTIPRVYLFVVDALRFDFFAPQHFRELHSLAETHPGNVQFFRQRSEPPTTTSQRLKALTTGTMPTFIDFSSNFGSSAISEDNWLDQLQKLRPEATRAFHGDDTWEALFPGRFQISRPIESFNTIDLDTVDDSIELELELRLCSSWELLITHFLGVDHIGHTHHASHPLMHERLERMDKLAVEVINRLKEDAKLPEMGRDSIFILMGDHGMTDDGNHGGATEEETDSVFFIFSTNSLLPLPLPVSPVVDVDVAGSYNNNIKMGTYTPSSLMWDDEQKTVINRSIDQLLASPRLVKQIDLVPTLSLLLGIPIPFSNVGKIIPEMFLGAGRANTANAFMVNSLQVMRFLRHYDDSAATLLSPLLHKALTAHVEAADNAADMLLSGDWDEINAAYSSFLDAVAGWASEEWTSFDLASMILGLVLAGLALIGMFVHALVEEGCDLSLDSAFWARLIHIDNSYYLSIISVIVTVVHAVGAGSDNFVKNEGLFLLVAAIIQLVIWYKVIISSKECHDLRFLFKSLSGAITSLTVLWVIRGYSKSGVTPFKLANLGIFELDLELPLEVTCGIPMLIFVGLTIVCLKPVSIKSFPFVVESLSVLLLIVSQFTSILMWREQRKLGSHEHMFGFTIIFLNSLGLLLMLLLFSFSSYAAAASAQDTKQVVCKHLVGHLGTILVASSGSVAPIQFLFLTAHLYFARNLFSQGITSGSESHQSSSLGITWVLYVALIARLAYFTSGHVHSFSDLQLAAGFLGSKDFHFAWAGSLLIVNTFGYDILSLFICIFTCSSLSPDRGILRILTLQRAGLLLASAVATSVLRRHLMVWAVFAPKLLFEASFFIIHIITAFIHFVLI